MTSDDCPHDERRLANFEAGQDGPFGGPVRSTGGFCNNSCATFELPEHQRHDGDSRDAMRSSVSFTSTLPLALALPLPLPLPVLSCHCTAEAVAIEMHRGLSYTRVVGVEMSGREVGAADELGALQDWLLIGSDWEKRASVPIYPPPGRLIYLEIVATLNPSLSPSPIAHRPYPPTTQTFARPPPSPTINNSPTPTFVFNCFARPSCVPLPAPYASSTED
ncbi:hypothetical protein E2P81_ATG06722 [Venturia nashicola]|nr:hypothetical protein E2P81_ATG06722 [Venturia nashicola]